VQTTTDVERVQTVIIGGGPAGLATSQCLGAAGVSHVVLERGRLAERWRSERWDSLRLLTPNWMTRLPGRPAVAADPDGFMTAAEVVAHLEDYVRDFDLPVREHTSVERCNRIGWLFRVTTDRGVLLADQVVVATGATGVPHVPGLAARLDPRITQLHARDYRRPAQLPKGGVLVVGAAASGVQIADELARDGRDVTLAVGRHTRLPRRYRGRDIHGWLDDLGVLDRPAATFPDRAAGERDPSLQLVGRPTHEDLDLATLQAAGVRLVGRVVQADDTRVTFADDLAVELAAADDRLGRLLDRIDAHVAATAVTRPPADRPRPVPHPLAPAVLDLEAEDVTTIVWATGYRRAHPWLELDVLDERGEIVHHDGATDVPGLHVIGMPLTRRRNSTYLGGIGIDAALLARELTHGLAGAGPRLATTTGSRS
jgi:putative flavoprotein involved in K+ transport